MRYLYLISTFIIYAFITSCRNTGKFEITNETSEVIDSIYMQPSEPATRKYISLMPNETKNYTLDMSKITGDGAFGIVYKFKSIPKTTLLEYYSNGTPPEKLKKIYIHPDTVVSK